MSGWDSPSNSAASTCLSPRWRMILSMRVTSSALTVEYRHRGVRGSANTLPLPRSTFNFSVVIDLPLAIWEVRTEQAFGRMLGGGGCRIEVAVAGEGDEFGHSYRNVDAGARLVDIPTRLVAVDAPAGRQLHAVQVFTASEAPQYDLSNAIGTRCNNDVVWTYQHVEFSAAVQVIGRQRTYLGIDGGIHHFAGQKISLADESGDKTVSRVMEELLRRGHLLDLTLADDSHLIRQGEGLFLVVGDENRSFVGLAKDRLDLFHEPTPASTGRGC